MRRHLIPLTATALICTSAAFAQAQPTGIETLGHARFTVITPNLIRMENSPSNQFVDASSLFATKRQTRFRGYTVKRDAKTLFIETPALRLTYTEDGRPFGDTNLRAEVRKGNTWVKWTPTTENSGNLGGTIATLDGVSGPVKLNDGVLSRDGWYLLDDSKRPLFTTDWVQGRPQNAGQDWYFFGYGTDYKAALSSLTTVSGKVPLPRRYTLGTWYSRYWPYTSDDYRELVREYKQHDFPLDVMVLDMDWHRDGWTGWSWNRKLLPDAEKLLSDLHAQGLAVTLNVHPADGVRPDEDAYPDFMRALGQDPASRQTVPFDAGNKRYLDTLFEQVHAPLERSGVDFWWLDWQQQRYTRSIPSLTNLEWLNNEYYKWTSRDGKRGQSMSRWGGWGDQRNPIHFSGDSHTGWDMLSFAIPFTSTSSNTGLFYWTHDIGGHQGGRNEESYARWCQFGALTASLRSHSTRDATTDRRPWNYPAWAEESMRRSFHLRSELFPYIYTAVAQSSRESIPLLRPLYFEFPNVEAAYHNGQEYKFGDNLLVAPITSPGTGDAKFASQHVWFPAGTWYDWFTGEKYNSGQKALIGADINEFPLFARGGVPIVMQPYTERMTTAPLRRVRLRCFPGEDGQLGRASLYEDDGVTTKYENGSYATTEVSYVRRGNAVTVEVAPTKGTFDGQLSRRALTIELPATQKAVRATVAGKTVPVKYDAVKHINFVELPEADIRRTTKVEIVAAPLDDTISRQQAALKRVSTILGRPVTSIEAALDAVKAPTGGKTTPDATAVLNALGIGFTTVNEAPYFWGGVKQTSFFAPANLPLQAQLLTGDKRVIKPGDVVDLSKMGAQLAPRDQIVIPGKTKVPVSLNVYGRQMQLSVPVTGAFNPNGNLARIAQIDASSTDSPYRPRNAIDGIMDGYPGNRSNEWSSKEEKVGASLTLSWSWNVTVGRVLLFDRPNANDQVTSARLTFDDGSVVNVGALPNDGLTPAEVTFIPRTTRWVKIEVTGVRPETENVGFSEVAVFPK